MYFEFIIGGGQNFSFGTFKKSGFSNCRLFHEKAISQTMKYSTVFESDAVVISVFLIFRVLFYREAINRPGASSSS
jgi:hypothetical protein